MILPDYKKRLPTNWSVSQVSLFLDCARKWGFKSLYKIPDPPNEAAARGSAIHKALENVGAQLADGADLETALAAHHPDDAPWMAYVRALAGQGLLPNPGEASAREHRFTLPTHTEISFIGVIDLVLDERSPIEITDWKSVSDVRYAKTPLELTNDLQLITYAHYIFQNTDVDTVRARLAYVEAKKIPLKTKLPRVVDVHVDLDRESVRRIWQGELPFGDQTKDHRLPLILDKMLETAAFADDPQDIPPTTTTCTKYGGCPYRGQCGLSPLAGIASARNSQHEPLKRISIQESYDMGMLSGKTNGTNSVAPTKIAPPATAPAQTAAPTKPPAGGAASGTGFLARANAAKPPAGTGFLARANAAKPPGTVPAAPTEAARQAKLDKDFGPQGVPTGVVPPDAPSRMTSMTPASVQEPAQDEVSADSGEDTPAEAPKKRGRPPKAAAEGEAPAPAVRAGKAKQGMTLYVDCYPIRGVSEVMTFGDDWYSSVEMAMDEKAAEEDLASFWLWPFARQKMELALAVKAKIDKGLPPVMLIKSSSNMAREALSMLIPHAQIVVQAIR